MKCNFLLLMAMLVGGCSLLQGDDDPDHQGSGSLHFAVYGDTRTVADMHQKIIDLIAATDPELVLHSGDLWDGYSAEQWKNIITSHANLETLLNDNLFLVTRGNHESGNAVLNFSPTIVRDDSLVYSLTKGNVFFISLAMNPESSEDFLSQALQSDEAQNADWRVVLAHYPIYSAGSHGGNSMPGVEALFDEYGVDLFFCGHDHHYERSHHLRGGEVIDTSDELQADFGTVYIVTGGGGAPLYSVGDNKETHTAKSIQHYVDVVASESSLVVTAIDKSGKTIDSFSITR